MEYTTEDLSRRGESVILVEALGPPYFASGHIPGAINIPPHRVADLAPELLPDREASIVVYGSGRGCRSAAAVLRRLAGLGYQRLSTYPDGKTGWAEAGLPLAGSDPTACADRRTRTSGGRAADGRGVGG